MNGNNGETIKVKLTWKEIIGSIFTLIVVVLIPTVLNWAALNNSVENHAKDLKSNLEKIEKNMENIDKLDDKQGKLEVTLNHVQKNLNMIRQDINYMRRYYENKINQTKNEELTKKSAKD